MSLIAPQDAAFLLGESSAQPTHVAGLAIYELPPGADADYVGGLYHELLTHTELRPQLRKRPADPVGSLGNIWWTEERDVDVEYHVRLAALPRPGRVRELLELVSRLHGQALDRHRPLWEFYLIEGLEGGRFATYTKIHHSLYDGVASTQLLTDWLSHNPDTRGAIPWWSATHHGAREVKIEQADGRARGVVARAARTVGKPVRLAADLAGIASSVGMMTVRSLRGRTEGLPYRAPRTILNTSITGSRRFAADQWPLERIKNAGAPHDATVNDVVLAMCAGAVRRYLIEQDALPDSALTAGVPVSLRSADASSDTGNAVGIVPCNLATHLDDPHERLAAIITSMNAAKAELATQSPFQIQLRTGVLAAGSLLSTQVPWAADFAPVPVNLIISNVPGPREPLYWNGARMQGVYPLSVPQQGQALNITVFSYAGLLNFGVTGCRRRLPHLQHMLTYLEDSLVELETATAWPSEESLVATSR
jgi:diacylglycerol O-acyltransferase / wax synthase